MRRAPGSGSLVRIAHPTRERTRAPEAPPPRRRDDPVLGRRAQGPDRQVPPRRQRPGRGSAGRDVERRQRRAGVRGARPAGRGQPGPPLLAREAGAANYTNSRTLRDEEDVLAWAEAYRRATGAWPTPAGEPVVLPPGQTWALIDRALREGYRGLSGGDSLATLLADMGDTQ